jgi:histidinol-phosphate/aromatic aminotransferase/cobyric acid decarboxylase-like protein
VSAAASSSSERHGGNLAAAAARLGCRPEQLLDASASLVPFRPPAPLRRVLRQAALRPYPDREYTDLRRAIAVLHQLDPAWVLPGNGAAELFTWAARDAAALGRSQLPEPGFADYRRALACWGSEPVAAPLPLECAQPGGQPGLQPSPQPWPLLEAADRADAPAVLWVTNPHNPTGQLWSRASLEPLLRNHALVICDEAFLPLVAGGEAQSLVPLLASHSNLVVIRSLTKLFAIAGLRLGYALGDPQRLARWSGWRDPWPVNGLAAAAGEALLADARFYGRWCRRVQGCGLCPRPPISCCFRGCARGSRSAWSRCAWRWSSAIASCCAIAARLRDWGRAGCASATRTAPATAASLTPSPASFVAEAHQPLSSSSS